MNVYGRGAAGRRLDGVGDQALAGKDDGDVLGKVVLQIHGDDISDGDVEHGPGQRGGAAAGTGVLREAPDGDRRQPGERQRSFVRAEVDRHERGRGGRRLGAGPRQRNHGCGERSQRQESRALAGSPL